ncbi:vertnin [Plakobranchus ocellatus]|uniref:Vertnin n=1 Tax=Plakobranchus ocellatus TaxID=259542 RepID=A0AAV4BEU2_9GAST|nr:vertnin [Plakobranchus ocellatus]
MASRRKGEEGECENISFTLGWKPFKSFSTSRKHNIACTASTRKPPPISPLCSTPTFPLAPLSIAPPAFTADVQMPNKLSVPQSIAASDTQLSESLVELMDISNREVFFEKMQTILCSCDSYDEIKNIAPVLVEVMAPFVMEPCKVIEFNDVKRHGVDECAQPLAPEHVPAGLVPISVVGDGNCMPRSLCLAASGSDGWHSEMRCRTALELTMKESFYTCSKFLSNDGDLQGDKLLETICKLSSSIVSTGENEIGIIATFGEEVLSIFGETIIRVMAVSCTANARVVMMSKTD